MWPVDHAQDATLTTMYVVEYRLGSPTGGPIARGFGAFALPLVVPEQSEAPALLKHISPATVFGMRHIYTPTVSCVLLLET